MSDFEFEAPPHPYVPPDAPAPLPAEPTDNGTEPAEDDHPAPPHFVPAADFLDLDFPQAKPLLGQVDNVFLPRGGWLNAYGQAGSSKTTLNLDLIVHLAAGTPWLDLPIPGPARIALVVNEGPPALLQAKLAHKARSWTGPEFMHNIVVFVSPWGYFTFALENHRKFLRHYCTEEAIDIVYGDPLQLLGAPGAGTPADTAVFRSWLAECGLMDDVAFITAHHENKSGQMSGAYEGHSDTTLHVEQSGNAGTRITWRKVRHAETPNPRRWELGWAPESRGFTRLELPTAASDDDILEEIDAFLEQHPRSATKAVLEGVGKRAERVRDLLKEHSAEGGKYAVENGPKGAKLWSLTEGRPSFADDRDDLLAWEDDDRDEYWR